MEVLFERRTSFGVLTVVPTTLRASIAGGCLVDVSYFSSGERLWTGGFSLLSPSKEAFPWCSEPREWLRLMLKSCSKFMDLLFL